MASAPKAAARTATSPSRVRLMASGASTPSSTRLDRSGTNRAAWRRSSATALPASSAVAPKQRPSTLPLPRTLDNCKHFSSQLRQDPQSPRTLSSDRQGTCPGPQIWQCSRATVSAEKSARNSCARPKWSRLPPYPGSRPGDLARSRSAVAMRPCNRHAQRGEQEGLPVVRRPRARRNDLLLASEPAEGTPSRPSRSFFAIASGQETRKEQCVPQQPDDIHVDLRLAMRRTSFSSSGNSRIGIPVSTSNASCSISPTSASPTVSSAHSMARTLVSLETRPHFTELSTSDRTLSSTEDRSTAIANRTTVSCETALDGLQRRASSLAASNASYLGRGSSNA